MLLLESSSRDPHVSGILGVQQTSLFVQFTKHSQMKYIILSQAQPSEIGRHHDFHSTDEKNEAQSY